MPGLVVVKKGYIHKCNERIKDDAKALKPKRRIKQYYGIQAQQTTSSLKKRLDQIFSIYIRNKFTDEKGCGKCFTCGAPGTIKTLQCGHFISRRHYPTRWEEDNCRPQCVKCNMFNQGNSPAFGIHLQSELGEGIIQKLETKKNNKFDLSVFVLNLLIKEFTTKIKAIVKEQ
jgi:5-methylcytosine-specific restriction endonuclease McrA